MQKVAFILLFLFCEKLFAKIDINSNTVGNKKNEA